MSNVQRAVVALGSNLGDREAMLRSACATLQSLGAVVACSRLYETAPVGPAQPLYLNAVALVDTSLSPRQTLDVLLEIERLFGRQRGERWGARTLDLDLIAHGQSIVNETGLTLPHPEAARRAFVLVPLCELAPEWTFPDGQTADALARSLAADALVDVKPVFDAPPPSNRA